MPEPADRVISVLVADDDEAQRLLVETILHEVGWAQHEVTCVPDGREALRALREQVFDVALLDLSMPGLDGLEVFEAIGEDPHRPQVIFVSGQGTVESATRAMKLGAYDFVEKPVDGERLAALVWKAAQTQAAITRSELFKEVASRETSAVSIITEDAGMKEALRLVARVADSDVSVLVHGESGTGKELIARELHRLSSRATEPLVALNCAAVAESLAESELFGHEKGAFTGAATRKIGLCELADGGTLFLDEIGDLSLPLQAKLLRVLETKHFRRVGGVKEFPTNFRLVSATNRPLKQLVAEEAFRGDLYYRINAIVLDLPPLRDRTGDLASLVGHFLSEFRPGDAHRWTVEPEAVRLLESYTWPGNVRELRNVIERAALLARDETIGAADLGSLLSDVRLQAPPDGHGNGSPAGAASGDDARVPTGALPVLHLEELERMAIEEALARTGWHQGRASDLLGLSARTLHRKIRQLGLQRPVSG
jgi:DNA-binding NtrC family response regulator